MPGFGKRYHLALRHERDQNVPPQICPSGIKTSLCSPICLRAVSMFPLCECLRTQPLLPGIAEWLNHQRWFETPGPRTALLGIHINFTKTPDSPCVVWSLVVSDSATPRTVTHQAPLSMGFPRQEDWSALPFPSPNLPLVFSYINLPSHILVPLRLPRWLSGEEPACQWRRCEFDPWVGKIPWRRKWQPIPVFLLG